MENLQNPLIWEQECGKLMDQNKQLQEMLNACWKQLDAVYRASSELQNQNAHLLKDMQTLDDLYHQMRDERDELAATCRSLESEIRDLRQRNSALDSQFRFSSSQFSGFNTQQQD